MPPLDEAYERTLADVVEDVGLYPLEAYSFLQQGLTHTVKKIHGRVQDPEADRHVCGQQLCEGLRDLAWERWGCLARTVLERWNVTSTYDFGKMVFSLVEAGLMSKTDQDGIDDFRNVFDFSSLEKDYRIQSKL